MDEDRDEISRLAHAVKERLEWLERGGVVGLPRRSVAAKAPVAQPAASAPVRSPSLPVATESLEAIRADLGDCTRCKLAPTRTNIVFGVGDPRAALVFVGEAPGADEDASGEPFVGAAGQLLTKMIGAMGFQRGEVYIANIIKCRPPKNRNPEADEIEKCEPFLIRQLGALQPRMIVTLGKFAAQTLLRSQASISSLRGRFHQYQGIPLMPTFHPAFLLRQPEAKREVWNDLQKVMGELDKLGIARRTS